MSSPTKPEELHAPEVMKPRNRKPTTPVAQPLQPNKTVARAKPPPKPPPIKQAPPQTATKKSAAKRRESPPPVPQRKPGTHTPPAPPKHPRPKSAPQPKKKSSAAGWIAVLVSGGIVMFVWYAAKTNPTHQQVVPPSRSPIAKRPAQTTPDPPQRAAEASRKIVPPRRASSRPPVARLGDLAIAAIAVAADGRRYRITGPASLRLTDRVTGRNASTNAILPFRWSNLPLGQYKLDAEVTGYSQKTHVLATIKPLATEEVSIQLRPLPSQVRFVVSPENVQPTIYRDSRSLGKAPGPIELDPFVEHTLVFRAPGWREYTKRIRIPKPGNAFKSTVEMQRIQAGLRVTVNTPDKHPPTRGLLRINTSKSVEVDLPFKTQRIPYEGEAIVYLDVDGYTGVSSQRVTFADRKLAEVVFALERPSWGSRALRSISGVFTGKEEE